MTDWINFREIRARVTLEQVLTQYYALTNLKRTNNIATGPCPVHGGDSPRAFHVDYDKGLWHCFTQCKRGGNQLDLVACKDNVPVREAALRLKRFFLDDDNPPPAAPAMSPPLVDKRQPQPARSQGQQASADPRKKKEPPVNPPLGLELQLLPDHPHILEDRKLQQSTAEDFGIGYCARGILAGCIGIPIHDDAGVLVAYAGRRLKFSEVNELGKYRFPKGFHKDRVLYNLHRAMPEADGEFGLVLVEGFFSVLRLHEMGIQSAVAVMGSDLSDHQAALAGRALSVTVLFDGDAAGAKGAMSAVEKLAPLTRVHAVMLPPGAEPESCNADLLRWLLAGVRRHNLSMVSFQTVPLPVLLEASGHVIH